jgi:uncharacterized membrane protein required for colicin V production
MFILVLTVIIIISGLVLALNGYIGTMVYLLITICALLVQRYFYYK